MTDVRLWPAFLGDVVIDDLSSDAFRVLVNSMVYAASHETDGLIATKALRHLHPEVDALGAAAAELVAAEMWLKVGVGWQIPGWDDHQTSSAALEQRRAADRAKKARQAETRRASAGKPGRKTGGNPLVNTVGVPVGFPPGKVTNSPRFPEDRTGQRQDRTGA